MFDIIYLYIYILHYTIRVGLTHIIKAAASIRKVLLKLNTCQPRRLLEGGVYWRRRLWEEIRYLCWDWCVSLYAVDILALVEDDNLNAMANDNFFLVHVGLPLQAICFCIRISLWLNMLALTANTIILVSLS